MFAGGRRHRGRGRIRAYEGAPAFTLLHVASGFANGIAMLHNAGRANTPVVNVVGSNASYHQPNYPEHELINGRVTDLARAVSHWCHEARSASHLGELGAEAAALVEDGQGLHHRGADQLPLGRGQPPADSSLVVGPAGGRPRGHHAAPR